MWESFSRWEQGVRGPSWANIVALARALGVGANASLQPPAARAPARGPAPQGRSPRMPAGSSRSARGAGPRTKAGARMAGPSAVTPPTFTEGTPDPHSTPVVAPPALVTLNTSLPETGPGSA